MNSTDSLLARIAQRANAHRHHPFLLWLSDPNVSARARLSAWLPGAAFFVMGFRDLNAQVPPYPADEARVDALKEAINRHLTEDLQHWERYLEDLAQLDLDHSLLLSDALRMLWGEDNAMQRTAAYQFCTLPGRTEDPLLRYSLIAALQVVAHILFETVIGVSRTFTQETGKVLNYLGPVHVALEPGHLVSQGPANLHALMQACAVPADQERGALRIVDTVYGLIERRWHEFLRMARTSSDKDSDAPPPRIVYAY